MNSGSILVVDDDPAIRITVTELLELAGHTVTAAANGAEALRAIDREAPALILLDVNMPLIDGRDFARLLKERGVNLPIVVMTANQYVRFTAEELHAAGYLAKPFEIEDVLETVDRLIAEDSAKITPEAPEFRFDWSADGRPLTVRLRPQATDRITVEVSADGAAPGRIATYTLNQWQALCRAAEEYHAAGDATAT